jgi:hypothetical protein
MKYITNLNDMATAIEYHRGYPNLKLLVEYAVLGGEDAKFHQFNARRFFDDAIQGKDYLFRFSQDKSGIAIFFIKLQLLKMYSNFQYRVDLANIENPYFKMDECKADFQDLFIDNLNVEFQIMDFNGNLTKFMGIFGSKHFLLN